MAGQADLLLTHGHVLTMDDERRVLADGAVAVAGDRIVAVGPTAEVAAAWQAPTTLDAAGAVVHPGFVDAHVHTVLHLGRSTIPDWWDEGREHDQWHPYRATISVEEERLSVLLACLEMALNGTTTFCDMGAKHPGEHVAEVVEQVGLRGMVCETVWDLPPYADVATGDTAACLGRLSRLVERHPPDPARRVWGGVGLPGMGRCSDALLREAKALADAHGLVLYMHQSFAERDVAAYLEHTGGKLAVAHLADLGVLDPRLQLVHMIHAHDHEVALLAEAGAHVVHCPGVSLRMGLGVSRAGRIPEMVASGVNVALGSDAGNQSDSLDVGRQAHLAATIHREARGACPPIDAATALEMATINGARAMGVDHLTGSLEVGKKADLVVRSATRPELLPRLDVVTGLVYSAQGKGVRTVVVDGRVVVDEGVVATVDDGVWGRIQDGARGLFERMGFALPDGWPRPTA